MGPDDLELLIDELEREDPGIRQRIEDIRAKLQYAAHNAGKCIECRVRPTMAVDFDHSCEMCEDTYDWYCFRCANPEVDWDDF